VPGRQHDGEQRQQRGVVLVTHVSSSAVADGADHDEQGHHASQPGPQPVGPVLQDMNEISCKDEAIELSLGKARASIINTDISFNTRLYNGMLPGPGDPDEGGHAVLGAAEERAGRRALPVGPPQRPALPGHDQPAARTACT
jgi:hypothetical protein